MYDGRMYMYDGRMYMYDGSDVQDGRWRGRLRTAFISCGAAGGGAAGATGGEAPGIGRMWLISPSPVES